MSLSAGYFLQAVWMNYINLDKTSGLILIQAVCHSDGILKT